MRPKRPTALITGASSGIGRDFAERLAAERHDLILTARSEDRLRALARDLEVHGTRISVLRADLSEPGAASRLAAEVEARGLRVDVLINNAGYGTYGLFADLSLPEQLRMIQLNIGALTELTWQLLPGMIARRHGRVLNVASTAAFFPGPLMAVYYASKAFVLSFSEALACELRGTGVTVTALCPGPTATGFQARAGLEGSRLFVSGRTLSSADVVDEAYQALLRGQTLVIPGRTNRLQTFLTRLVPRAVLPDLVRKAQERIH
ncbi:hypothetical protein HNR42_000095 [Deinobacterium chartae]|uniref:Ketoreductase domain-containing protein n=1 Tax=Deinobacterium chartae TaxID=521158 RepID=A0A841HV31_9DEIO|nr:SDR family oxidoreductase [Deinobacterium chartae]MBB6096683.1 hypothetical protein [Deinobacterium chartae]